MRKAMKRFLFHGGAGAEAGAAHAHKQVEAPGKRAAERQGATGKAGLSEAATDSYTGGSSVMSVDPAAESEETKCPDSPELAGAMDTDGARAISGYEIMDTLGKGMSGKVKRGFHRATNQYVALKVIDKATTPRRVLQMLSTEIAAMRTLAAHPNVLTLLHYELAASYPRKNGGKRDVVLLALELAEGGELFDFMMYTGAFQEPIAKAIFQQMASALAYCHEHGIYHRDIKPENLLLDSNFNLKVADFGLAAMRANPDDLLRTECGTRSYMAPEVLARQQYDGQKSDCWSAGVVLFIMLSGNPPFQMARPGDWWFNQFTEGRPDRFWKSHKRYSPHFPEAAQELLTHIFTPNPANRPTLKEVLADPWVSSSTFSPDQVRAELASRRAKILKEKEAERERARQKRAAGQYGGGTQQDFDPDKVKHRDVGVNGSTIHAAQEDPAPPAKPMDLKTSTALYTAEGPSTAYRRSREALTMMNAKLVGDGESAPSENGNGHKETTINKYALGAIVPIDLEQVDVTVRVLSVPGEGTTMLCVTRRDGDVLAFQRAFRAFAAATVDLHGEVDKGQDQPELVGPVPLDDDELEGNLEGQELNMI